MSIDLNMRAAPPPRTLDDRVDLVRLIQEPSGSAMPVGIRQNIIGAGTTGYGAAAGTMSSRNKSFTVKPIKNGYIMLANNEEFFCADLDAVAAQTVAIMAAHMME